MGEESIIYREDIAYLQTKIKKCQQSIVQGELEITTLLEFNDFFETCKEYAIQYQTIYKKVNGLQERKELHSFLAEEMAFLQLIVSILKGLSHYHDVIGCIDNHEIMEEWKKMRTLVLFQNTESQLKQIEKILRHSQNQSYYQKRRALLDEREATLSNVLQAEHDLIGKMATEYNSSEKEKYSLKKEDIEINFDFFSSIPITKKISYLKLLLKNNEKISGEKETILINGKEKSISTNSIARYRMYLLLLNSCELEYQRLLNKMVLEDKEYKTIPKEIFSNYLKLHRENEEIKAEMKTSTQHRKEKLEENSYQKEKALNQIEKEYNLEFIKTEEEYVSYYEKQEALFNQLYFLEKVSTNENVAPKIEEVKKEIRNLQHNIDFSIQIYLHTFLFSEPISADLRYFYVFIIMYSENFQNSSDYTDVQKESITNAIITLLEKGEFPYFVQAKIENVKQIYYSMPTKKKKHEKVFSKRKAKKKGKIQSDLLNGAIKIAVILGIASLVGLNYSKYAFEQPIKHSDKQEDEQKEGKSL